MQRGEKQLAGFGGSHGHLDGFQVPHLPQKDNVRTFPQSAAQGADIAGRIAADLPLGHDAAVVPVNVFDGVLHGNDVGLPAVVDGVDQAGQGGRFAAARRTGDQHHAFELGGSLQHLGRDAQGRPKRITRKTMARVPR